MKRGNRNKGLAAGCLIAVFLLVGCGRADGGSAEGMAQSGGSGDTQSDTTVESIAGEEKHTLTEELDELAIELADREMLWEPTDLMQDERAANFPEELVRQLQEALAAGTSDELLREMTDNSLKIERADFIYQPTKAE